MKSELKPQNNFSAEHSCSVSSTTHTLTTSHDETVTDITLCREEQERERLQPVFYSEESACRFQSRVHRIFKRVLVRFFTPFIGIYMNSFQILRTHRIKNMPKYAHCIVMNLFSLALQPQFGPCPTSMKLSVSLRFSRRS
jgi:hypothetical protein